MVYKGGAEATAHIAIAGISISQLFGYDTSGRRCRYMLICITTGPGFFVGAGLVGSAGIGNLPSDQSAEGEVASSLPDEIGVSGEVGSGDSIGGSVHTDTSSGGIDFSTGIPGTGKFKAGFGYGAKLGFDFCWIKNLHCTDPNNCLK
jgi:hypothetical protein